MGYFIGIDGGGTKTTALIYDSSGRQVACITGDSINYFSVGRENARKALGSIIAESGIDCFESAVIGMSALGGPATKQDTESFTDGILNAKHIYMDSDLYVALEAMQVNGPCGVVISGTGSMTAVRLADGSVVTAGGFGYILGDAGSGYDIGLRGIRSAIASFEGYGEKTVLEKKCLEFFGTDSIYGLTDIFYGEGVSRKRVAAFATDVRLSADDGDSVAVSVMRDAAKQLSVESISALRKAHGEIPVGLWGGIFENSSIFREEFSALLKSAGFGNVGLLKHTPQQGAVLAAFRLAGAKVPDNLI